MRKTRGGKSITAKNSFPFFFFHLTPFIFFLQSPWQPSLSLMQDAQKSMNFSSAHNILPTMPKSLIKY